MGMLITAIRFILPTDPGPHILLTFIAFLQTWNKLPDLAFAYCVISIND